jgi:hypothetical protein
MARTHWRDVPMPAAVRALPRTEQGYPILYTSYIDQHGVADLRVSLPQKRDECFQFKKCGICGQVLQHSMTFLGSVVSVENRCFGDPPFHYPCAEYARQVCPWLALRRERTHETAVMTPEGDPSKGTHLAFYVTRGYIGCRAEWPDEGYVFYADLPNQVIWFNQATGEREKPDPLPSPRKELPPMDLRLTPWWRQSKQAERARHDPPSARGVQQDINAALGELVRMEVQRKRR